VQPGKCDVVVRFDEASGKIVLLAVPSTQLEPLLHQPHAAWVGEVEKLRVLGHEKAEGLVGLRVLRELDRQSSSGLHLRDFETHEREELQSTLAALEQRANTGEPVAQLDAFRALWNQALKQKSLVLLERADGFLKAAAAQNYAPAMSLAAAWPKLKAEAQASIGKSAP